jgi:hypothetical protein
MAKFDPYFRYVAVGVGGITLDFTAIGPMSSILLRNYSVDPVFFRLDAVMPGAGYANDQQSVVQFQSVNLTDVSFQFLSMIAGGGGGPCNVDVLVLQRVGGGMLA